MELSPKAITGVQFRTARKGYDPEEVRAFLAQLARGVETIQAQAAASDARARSAVAKLQEMAAREEPDPGDAIKRTLLLAQRTADSAVAEAQDQAKAIVGDAEEQSRTMLAEAQTKSEQMVSDAESDARRAGSAEKARLDAEIAGLTSRRNELHAEATRLEGQISAQRGRINGAIADLQKVLDQPGGLQTSALPPPTAGPDELDAASGGNEPAGSGPGLSAPETAPLWSDTPGAPQSTLAPPHAPGSAADEDDVAGELARLGDAPTDAKEGEGGSPGKDVPVISGDDELVRNFFEPEPFSDDRWKGRRTE
jgi:cell division initiation protein